jgi:ubiquinone/menaquinone biosynthesis C-methylase UbiE
MMIMNSQQHFNTVAKEWDKDKMHQERSMAIAAALQQMIPLQKNWKALEYGAGTGLLSFILKDAFKEIVLIDNSAEMLKVCEEKIAYYQTPHIHTVALDLENTAYTEKFGIIYTQMVLHHIMDVPAIFKTFHQLLNAGGYLAIADLYTEDGSFHEPGMQVHKGFNPDELGQQLNTLGFNHVQHQTCFTIERNNGKKYPVFLLTAQKNQ